MTSLSSLNTASVIAAVHSSSMEGGGSLAHPDSGSRLRIRQAAAATNLCLFKINGFLLAKTTAVTGIYNVSVLLAPFLFGCYFKFNDNFLIVNRLQKICFLLRKICKRPPFQKNMGCLMIKALSRLISLFIFILSGTGKGQKSPRRVLHMQANESGGFPPGGVTFLGLFPWRTVLGTVSKFYAIRLRFYIDGRVGVVENI